jgi:Holliday junction resolvasome RuvABC endonuclease subunit
MARRKRKKPAPFKPPAVTLKKYSPLAPLTPRVLALDPGKRNSYWSLLGLNPKTGKWTITQTGYLDIAADKGVEERLAIVHRNLLKLLVRTEPDHFVIERFIVRRSGKGNVSEHINMLCGIAYGLCRLLKIEPHYLIASQHKQFLKKHFQKTAPEVWPWLNTHEADATSLAFYVIKTFLAKNSV